MKTGKIILAGLVGVIVLLHGWLTETLPAQAVLPLKIVKDVATEKGPVISSEGELYQQMQQVKEYLATKQYREALLVVKDLLQADPHNERAKILAQRLAKQIGEGVEGKDRKVLEEQFELWEKRWRQAGQEIKKGQWIAAYGELFPLITFFQEASVKPPYFVHALEQKKQVEEKLRQVLKPEIDRAQMSFTAKDWRAVLHQSSALLARYPDCAQVLEVKEKAIAALTQQLKPLKQSAETVLQLEGCGKALPLYQQLQQQSGTPEIIFWQEARKALDECQSTPLSQKHPAKG